MDQLKCDGVNICSDTALCLHSLFLQIFRIWSVSSVHTALFTVSDVSVQRCHLINTNKYQPVSTNTLSAQ